MPSHLLFILRCGRAKPTADFKNRPFLFVQVKAHEIVTENVLKHGLRRRVVKFYKQLNTPRAINCHFTYYYCVGL